MMSMGESVSYLKGLAEGLNIDKSTSEGKLLLAIVDVLDDMAAEIAEIERLLTSRQNFSILSMRIWALWKRTFTVMRMRKTKMIAVMAISMR